MVLQENEERRMDVIDAVVTRKSIRAFRPDPVPKKVIEEIMERALWAPSWGNTQPWNFTIVGGTTLEKIKEDSVRLLQNDSPTQPEYEMPTEFNEIQTSRYRDLGKDLFQALGIERGDKEARKLHLVNMTRCFGAPCVAYLHLHKDFNAYALMDGGIILQTIALLAVEQGLGTSILARSVRYPSVIRKYVPIPEDQVLVMGVAIGYPDVDHPASQFRSKRGKLEKFVRWVGVVE
jgi:nitroreductase